MVSRMSLRSLWTVALIVWAVAAVVGVDGAIDGSNPPRSLAAGRRATTNRSSESVVRAMAEKGGA
jgi:hypothetical protein